MTSKKARSKVRNAFHSEGARGGCFFIISEAEEKDSCGDPVARIEVGWSCVIVAGNLGRNSVVPISWLSELIAIATSHEGGIVGFLQEHRYGGSESYALSCDPPRESLESIMRDKSTRRELF